MSPSRTLRCAACGRRVRRNHPRLILVSGQTGKETYYHCRPDCEEMRAAWCEYHQGQAARHRAVLEELIARHEASAAKFGELAED